MQPRTLWSVLVIALLAALPLLLSGYQTSLATLTLIYALLAIPLALNLFDGQPVPRFNDIFLIGIAWCFRKISAGMVSSNWALGVKWASVMGAIRRYSARHSVASVGVIKELSIRYFSSRTELNCARSCA